MRWQHGLGAVALIAVAACNSGDDGQALAVQECKDSVQANLSYDGDFPFLSPAATKDSDGTWHVSGSVKAQNGFGATRTLHWTCTVDSSGRVTTSAQ